MLDIEMIIKACRTALCSKVVNRCQDQLARICAEAVVAVADMEHRDVNLDLIKIQTRVGGSLEDSALVRGIVLDKQWSHPQMPKEIKDAKIAILTCPFEPPKPKTKHSVYVTSAEEYDTLYQEEQKYFTDMIDCIKKAGANTVMCQWGFDDEANFLLLKNGLQAVRWVGGVEMEVCSPFFALTLSHNRGPPVFSPPRASGDVCTSSGGSASWSDKQSEIPGVSLLRLISLFPYPRHHACSASPPGHHSHRLHSVNTRRTSLFHNYGTVSLC